MTRVLALLAAAAVGGTVLAAAAVVGFVAYDGWAAERDGRP